jgi:C1A family cysteine protease
MMVLNEVLSIIATIMLIFTSVTGTVELAPDASQENDPNIVLYLNLTSDENADDAEQKFSRELVEETYAGAPNDMILSSDENANAAQKSSKNSITRYKGASTPMEELAGAGADLQVTYQTPDTNAAKDQFFDFTTTVKCFNETCNNVILTLDPSESKSKKEYPDFTEEDVKEAEKRLKKIKNKIKDKNLKWEAGLSPAFIDYVRKDRKGEIVYTEQPTEAEEEELAGSAITQEEETILPYYFDWRNAYGENWVTSSKNQGGCASCWAFAAVGVAEAALNIYNKWPGLDLDLSEQDLVSCGHDDSALPDAGNCITGGSDNKALYYIKNTGVVDETCFPYSATDEPCSNICTDGKQYHIQDKFTVIDGGGEAVDKEAAIKALLDYGPSTAWIRAYTDLYSYVNGIYEPSTGDNNGAHVINVIGYNETGDYFIIKNTWGTGFGMNGFGYIKSWVILNDSTILNNLKFTIGADKLSKGVIPMNSGTPFYTITQNPYDCGNLSVGETCSVTWQVNATGFHSSSWDFFTIINSDEKNFTSPNSTITIIGDYIPKIESIECESVGAWKNCSLIGSGTDLTRIRVNVTDENLNIQSVDIRLKEDGTVIAEGSGIYSSGFYVFNNADQTIDSNKDYIIEVDVSDETYSINGFILFEPTVGCVEDWQPQYDPCQINDQQLKYYIDSNACGTIADLPVDNGTYVGCDYCSYSVTNTTWSTWQDMEACQITDTQQQNRSRTEYDASYDSCYAVTGLPSDLWNGGNNITHWEFQSASCDYCSEDIQGPFTTVCEITDEQIQYYVDNNYATCCSVTGLSSDCDIDTPAYANQTLSCDYCTPNWRPYNTSCNGTHLTQYYLDDNDCYSITGLADDLLGKPANQTFPCGGPDLNIENYEYYWPQNPVANSSVMFKIVLKNTGHEPTDNIYWTMDTDSGDQNPEYGPFSLAVDEFVNIYPQYKYSLPGNYNPRFIVDYLDLVVEENESNNEAVIPVTIS